MKKALYLAVLAGAIPLMACGSSSSSSLILSSGTSTPISSAASASSSIPSSASSSGLIPSGGNSIAVSAGANALSEAVSGISNSDKMGLTLSNANFSAALKAYGISEEASVSSVKAAAVPDSYLLTGINASASLSNFSASLLAEGLTATDPAKVKASFKAAGDVAYSIDVTKPGNTEITLSQSQSGVTAAAYLSAQHLYLDASNAAFVNLINGILGEVTSDESQSYSSISGGKYDFGAVLSPDSLPILSSETISSIQGFGTQMAAVVNEFSTYFKAVQYTDGSYGLSISLTKNDLMAIALNVYNQETESSAASLPADVSSLFSGLTVTSLSGGIVYTDTGLKSVTTDIDVSYLGTLADELAVMDNSVALSSTDAAKVVSCALKISGTINVLTGSDVTVTIPDLTDYTAVDLGS